MGWVVDYWDFFYQNIYPKMCVYVLGLRWMELTFDLCDCISCSQEALQSTTCSASHTLTPEKQYRRRRMKGLETCGQLAYLWTGSAPVSVNPSNMHNMGRHFNIVSHLSPAT